VKRVFTPGRLFLLLLVLLASLHALSLALHETLAAPGPAQTTIDVVIPDGGSASVADALQKAGVISNSFTFQLVEHYTRAEGPVHAGEYLIPARSSVHEVLDILRHGSPVQHQVTIPEGLTGVQIAAIINALPAATGHVSTPPEGAVLPQTYDYIYGTPRTVILARTEVAMRQNLQTAWTNRARGLPVQTPADVLALAAIVQEETPVNSELPKVAAVYENRLKQGMKLQADPTVIFAATGGRQSGGAEISKTDLANPSPYNTYAHVGLPPGPICAPGLAAINAVLHPADIDALYFVATGTGGHVFSHDFQDHLRNIAAYHAALKKPKTAEHTAELTRSSPHQ
jgi:UPF0755 protein